MCYYLYKWWRGEKREDKEENDSTWKSLLRVLSTLYNLPIILCGRLLLSPVQEKLSFLAQMNFYEITLIWEVAEQWHKFISHNSAAWVLYIMALAFQRETRLL